MDSDGDDYNVTDSEEEYDEDERNILNDLRKEREERRKNKDTKQELLLFSDSDDDDNADAVMHDSDIEGGEQDDDDDLPDTMNWGGKKKAYYNTDFVDPDYSSYNAQEEDMALAEEEEAKKIQLRLAKQINEADFELDYMNIPQDTDTKTEVQSSETNIKVTSDLSGLNERERLQLMQKESPEFFGLTQEFQQYLNEVQKLISPVLNYAQSHQVPMVPALKFARLYQNILLTYCSNVSLYLLLKAARKSIKLHPVIKRLVQLKKLCGQMAPRYENFIRPQLDALLERIQDGDAFKVVDYEKRNSKLQILDKYEQQEQHTKVAKKIDADSELENGSEEDKPTDDEVEDEQQARRGITYQIAKNKGLTPHRKKELRNPRVKHRGKYRKALIRRKGAVRTVRKEVKRYGGEMSGIKATVTKSVKFKS